MNRVPLPLPLVEADVDGSGGHRGRPLVRDVCRRIEAQHVIVHARDVLLGLGHHEVLDDVAVDLPYDRFTERRLERDVPLLGAAAERKDQPRRQDSGRRPGAQRHDVHAPLQRSTSFSACSSAHAMQARIRKAATKMIHPSVTCMKPCPSAGSTK